MGLESGRVRALAVAPDGAVWVGTEGGAARYRDGAWQPFVRELPSPLVQAIAVTPGAVWLGTGSGLARLDRTAGTWESHAPGRAGNRPPAVVALAVDAQGNLWAGTLGGGLAHYDGNGWRTFVTTNSGLPLNTAQALHAGAQGDLWIGTAFATQPGGVLARLTLPAEEWAGVGRQRSGYSGSEPLALTEDNFGRLWIATRTAGVDIFDPAME
jgi:ligand-binding sensor domain-containing protein